MNRKLKLSTGLMAAASFFALHSTSQAQNLVYTPGDLMLNFYSASGSTDFEVDLGSILNYSGASSSFSISQYTSSQLTGIFSSLDSLTFSVVGGAPNGVPVGSYAGSTLFLSDPRSNPATQTTPFNQLNARGQNTADSTIQGIGNGAASFSANNPSASVHTGTAIAVANSDVGSYQTLAGSSGTLKGSTPGGLIVENTTPVGFTGGSSPIVSDLYASAPVNGQPATYLGYFTFSGNGSMTFTPASVPEPSTWVLCAFGGLVCATILRRKTVSA